MKLELQGDQLVVSICEDITEVIQLEYFLDLLSSLTSKDNKFKSFMETVISKVSCKSEVVLEVSSNVDDTGEMIYKISLKG